MKKAHKLTFNSYRRPKFRGISSESEGRYAGDKIDYKSRIKPKQMKRNSELISTLFLLNPSVSKMIKSG